ncbi:DUF11 domain-containing protein [Paenibacillus sp. RC67]|uniref:DUF11 domain-containing protein n=1 Tax=Paenibacillus sp. RC67 TaxID=3039392 RepID=UPI0024AD89AB|nr:DUF11 domain-containing protein [Paenibacillus sp. RC67]
MSPDPMPNPLLQNQSLVRFSNAGVEQVAYSNTVVTPLIGPNLTLIKSSVEKEASLGKAITYRIGIANTGNRDAEVTLFDTLPAGTAFIANSVLRDGVPLPGITPITGIPVGIIQINSPVEVVFQVIVVTVPSDLQISNQAEAHYTFVAEEERIVEGTVVSNLVTIPVSAFLVSASLVASTEYTFIGDIITYGITIINEGNETLSDLLVKMPLPPGTQFVLGSVVVDGMYAPSYNPIDGIPLQPLLPGASSQIAFRLQVTEMPPTSQLASLAEIQYTVGEYPYTLDTNPVTVQVVDPGLSIVNSVNYVRATISDTLQYQIVIVNDGSLALEVTLSISVPAGTLFVWDSIYINGIQLKGARPSDPIRLGLLAAGAQAIITFEASIPSMNTAVVPVISNQAKAIFTFRLPDGRIIQNSAISNTVETEVVVPIIELHAEVDPKIVEIGFMTECKVLAANVGNWPANIILTGFIPKGTSYVEGSLRVIGDPMQPNIVDGTVPLGVLMPSNTYLVLYDITVYEDDRLHRLNRYIMALYEYELNGRIYSGEVRSNVFTIFVEHKDE